MLSGVFAFCFDIRNTMKLCSERLCGNTDVTRDQSFIAEQYYKAFIEELLTRHTGGISTDSFRNTIVDLQNIVDPNVNNSSINAL